MNALNHLREARASAAGSGTSAAATSRDVLEYLVQNHSNYRRMKQVSASNGTVLVGPGNAGSAAPSA